MQRVLGRSPIYCRPSHLRRYSSAPSSTKPSAKLVAEIRKRTETSILKAREALAATNNDLEAALKWIDEDLISTGQQRASKLASRHAGQGLVSVAVLSPGLSGLYNSKKAPVEDIAACSIRAAMIELNCETDFVARSTIFEQLSRDVAWSIAFHSEAAIAPSGQLLLPVDTDSMGDAPLLHDPAQSNEPSTPSKSTIASAIRDTVAKVGEKISLRRAVSVVVPAFIPQFQLGSSLGHYVHNSASPAGSIARSGRIAALVLSALHAKNLPTLLSDPNNQFLPKFQQLERALARQVVGFETTHIHSSEEGADRGSPLYEQEFAMYASVNEDSLPLNKLGEALGQWSVVRGMDTEQGRGIEVSEFCKWTVGEGMEPS